MNRLKYLPKFTEEELFDRIDRKWDFSYRVPFPKWDVVCPQGCDDTPLLKQWRFFKRTNTKSKNPYRCDVKFKCVCCSEVFDFGVVVTEDYFPGETQQINWKVIRDELTG